MTLVSLSIEETPHKVAANGTKRGLTEPGGHELVTIYLMDFAAHGNSTLVERLSVLLEGLWIRATRTRLHTQIRCISWLELNYYVNNIYYIVKSQQS